MYLQIYPDEGHFLHSDGTQQHLSQSLVNFFGECFRLPEVVKDDQQEEDENDSWSRASERAPQPNTTAQYATDISHPNDPQPLAVQSDQTAALACDNGG